MEHLFSSRLIKRFFKYTIVFLLFVVIFLSYSSLDKLNIDEKNGYTFNITKGMNIKQLLDKLQKDNIIKNPDVIDVIARIKKLDKKLHVGEYYLEKGINVNDFLKLITSSKVIQYKFTIVPGWTFKQLLSELKKDNNIVSSIDNLSEKVILRKLDPDSYILPKVADGLFIADSYFYTKGTTDLDILTRSYNDLKKYLFEKCPNNVNKYKVLTLASIIEKEVKVEEELFRVSAVFHNRLKKKMRLQSDPTVIYALGDNYKNLLYKSDLKVDSKYNTYKYKGLPPSPIAIVGKKAIFAALHPLDTDDLYFVADNTGKHIFSKNLKDHNIAVQKTRK